MDGESFAEMFPKAIEAGWEYIDDTALSCPCGHSIEWDGQCPEGHVSPLRAAGMI